MSFFLCRPYFPGKGGIAGQLLETFRLLFLTDVQKELDDNGAVVGQLSFEHANAVIGSTELFAGRFLVKGFVDDLPVPAVIVNGNSALGRQ